MFEEILYSRLKGTVHPTMKSSLTHLLVPILYKMCYSAEHTKKIFRRSQALLTTIILPTTTTVWFPTCFEIFPLVFNKTKDVQWVIK